MAYHIRVVEWGLDFRDAHQLAVHLEVADAQVQLVLDGERKAVKGKHLELIPIEESRVAK